MDFKKYQSATDETAVYPTIGKKFIYPILGLNGEVGELTEKVKKLFRDHNIEVTKEFTDDVSKELGDILWYLARVATEFELDLEDIAIENIRKLRSRKERGVIKGEGDNR